MLNLRERIAPQTTDGILPTTRDVAISRMILIAAFAIGIFFRIWKINAMGYNTDEAVYSGQAAAIAGIPGLVDIFPIFRAHPLLIQFLLSIVYQFNFNDLSGRLLSVATGLGTIYLTYLIGKNLYGRLPGALAALFLALMPYHVIVSRQMLLDGPMVFFASLTLYLLVRFAKSHKSEWLIASGASMGLTFLAKETSIVLLGAIFAFLAVTPEVRVRIRDLLLAILAMIVVISSFPITLMLSSGGSSTGLNYLTWQLFRRPNHEWSFYLTTLPSFIGVLILLAALAGIFLLWRDRSWREKLLGVWALVPFLFFQIWPVKGFQYLLPIVPPLAVLAGRTFGELANRTREFPFTTAFLTTSVRRGISFILVAVTVISLGITTWQRIQPETSTTFLAGTGGVPGGREAGTWVKENIPAFARMMTIGPSMANILQFYGERRAYGLSVSPNPLHRNPSYTPIHNPDLQIRRTDLNYLVWDSFSAARSPFFSDKLLGYVNKYNGRAVHTENISVVDSNGNLVLKPVIIIYEVHP